MFTLDDLLATLTLEPVGPDRYRAANLQMGHAVVFGGQILAQSIVAALEGQQEQDGKAVKTLHTVFSRSGKPDIPLDVTVDRMHGGRALASTTVTMSQGDRLIARSIALLSVDEPDFIRHADGREGLSPPQAAPQGGFGPVQTQVVGDVDVNDPDAVGPPDLEVWARFAGAPDDRTTSQALLAFLSEGLLIGTAMRPHHGVGQALAHRTISTAVLSNTITFHEPFAAGDWMLVALHSPYAGHGRSYGRGDVFSAGPATSGLLVASLVQDALIRAMPEGGGAL